MADESWEPTQVPPRGTRWFRGADGSWTALAHDEPEPEPARPSSETGMTTEAAPAGKRGVSWPAIVALLGSVLLAVAWWGALGVEVTFVYLTASPMLDFMLLSVVTVAWCWFIYRWLSRR